MAGAGPDSQEGKGILLNFFCGGDVEGSGGNFKLPDHSIHHFLKFPPRFLGELRHRYCHHRGQSVPSVSGRGGGGPVRDLPGPEQHV